MTSAEIRQSFLNFFRSKQHTLVSSSSLMPDSPNLLFTNAGMNQFVPIFLAQTPCPYKPGRAADTQKCIRAGGKHNDLEDVGLDTYHHTFFEMLGNWSFGDYFKKEAIEWAWELVIDTWGLPPNRLYATVYKPGPGDPSEFDQEAYDHWAKLFKKAGLDPAVHIVNGNKKDNFWMMGDTGPCGPCSELHIDLTPKGDTKGSLVNQGDPRCIEIWNLVFIQFNANPGGEFSPLPAKHVDTGMGFERVCSIIQGTKHFKDFKNARISNYETDVFKPIFAELEKISGRTYTSTLPTDSGETEKSKIENDIAFRVIADHIRTLSFAIADGILPGNNDRNYVLRRILRRAVKYGRNLGLEGLFFYKLVGVVADSFGGVFPELREKREFIESTIRAEEESFSKTLDRGLELFYEEVSRKVGAISGDFAFKLYDTYGFPLDLTQLLARERGLTVDDAGFEIRMEEQRKRSQAAQKKEIISVSSVDETAEATRFVGFERLEVEAEVLSLKEAVLICDQSPFYAEMGGQVGDSGIVHVGGKKIEILNTQKSPQGVFLHKLKQSETLNAANVRLEVDAARRALIEAHHSATHLMHWALRKVLGSTVAQKGSYVGPDRLRFDFSHREAMKPEEISEVERLVNEKIDAADAVNWTERPYAQVKGDASILQFFGDKYGDTVRVVDIGGYSRELCGGTHVRNTSRIGWFKLVSESAIAAGVRRIEAICGEALTPYLTALVEKQEQLLEELNKKRPGAVLKNFAIDPSPELSWAAYEARAQMLAEIQEDLREWEKQQGKVADAERQVRAVELAASLVAEAQAGKIIARIEGDGKLLQAIADDLKNRFAGPVVLAAVEEGKVALIAFVPKELQAKVQAGKIIQAIAPLVGGKGGGRPDMAQGGGADATGVDAALKKAAELLGL